MKPKAACSGPLLEAFAEGSGHSVKVQKPSVKALPSAALGKELSEKNLTANRSLLEIETLPSAKFFAECQKSSTRQRPSLPSAALAKELHSAKSSLPSARHLAKDFFAKCQTLGKISTLGIGCS